MHKVYELRFGKEIYVGTTCQPMSYRIRDHKLSSVGVNQRLIYLLNNHYDEMELVIAGEFSNGFAALKYEKERYAEIKRSRKWKLINRFTPGREGAELSQLRSGNKIQIMSGNGWRRCSICWRQLTEANFYKDHSRSSGYGSRCIECHEFLKRCYYPYTGEKRTTMYGLAKKYLQEWRGYKTNVHPRWRYKEIRKKLLAETGQ